jgi:hypothetical protein
MNALNNMEKLENRLSDLPSRRYVEIQREQGKHCINIYFRPDTPVTLIQEIIYDFKRGCYPGLKVIENFRDNNLFDMRVCIIDCGNNRQHCYFDEQKIAEY